MVWRGATWFVTSGQTVAPMNPTFRLMGGGTEGSIGATASWIVGVIACVFIVLSILRQAIGLQQSPPNMLIVSLAMFLTWFVMDPVLTAAWEKGAGPLSRGEIELTEAIPLTLAPFRQFMAGRVDPDSFAAMQALRPGETGAPLDAPLSLLVPSFLLSEIQRAFEIGFLIFLPFLIIDLVVAAILMSMGMMMVPPSVVSLPFKLAFFVVADGWSLISGALVRSYF